MSFVRQRVITQPSKSEGNFFEKDDAHYISLGDQGYAISWINNSEMQSEPDHVFIKLFDAKGWPKGDEIHVANSV